MNSWTCRSLFACASAAVQLIALPWNCASASTLKTIYSFCSEQSCTDGYEPRSGVTLGAEGNLYGVTGGYSGAIYRLHPDSQGKSWTFAVLYRFCTEARCTDGFDPNGKLILDNAGNLYGMTSAGGSEGGGVAFKLSPARHAYDAWTLEVLTNFCFHKHKQCNQPSQPSSGLTYADASSGVPYDGASPLYGTTQAGGGPNDAGSAYRLTLARGKWSQKLLYSFDGASGALPGALLIDGADNLYGTTYNGGAGFQGTAFELAFHSHVWSRTILYNFCSAAGCIDGRNPRGPLVSNDFENLFGVADGGNGKHCGAGPYCGALFQISVDGVNSRETVLYNFCSLKSCRDGALPSGIALDASGQIFGVTEFGGQNKGQHAGRLGAGTLFAFDGKFHKLYDFCSETNCTDGEAPEGDLAADAAGDVFGTTFYGGSGAYRDDIASGTVFELAK
ncbi:MAG TPA: choice-of-anchor tandem repeat GloVer-containing protein [Rhizomicrobium sp.]|jgi:uncharacterized repeat protein (TIGR03803 family)|nr:choice-of-anchor tandem repeat GloVer-containing protein [Rhizomicrobium sp.]